VSIGSWKYVKNLQQFGTPFFANGSAAEGFSGTGRQTYWGSYEFGTLRVHELLELTRQSAPPGKLTELPVYRSFWTTLHGLMWGDMGFFSNPTRHGSGRPLYRDRHVPQWLSSSVLSLGFVPSALAAMGLMTMLTHRSSRPLVLICAVGLTSYVYWVVGQQFWAIKAKYLLFFLPAYIVFFTGVKLLIRVLPSHSGTRVVINASPPRSCAGPAGVCVGIAVARGLGERRLAVSRFEPWVRFCVQRFSKPAFALGHLTAGVQVYVSAKTPVECPGPAGSLVVEPNAGSPAFFADFFFAAFFEAFFGAAFLLFFAALAVSSSVPPSSSARLSSPQLSARPSSRAPWPPT
jgi:hypothetical protein